MIRQFEIHLLILPHSLFSKINITFAPKLFSPTEINISALTQYEYAKHNTRNNRGLEKR
jgi:hypothetical protein